MAKKAMMTIMLKIIEEEENEMVQLLFLYEEGR